MEHAPIDAIGGICDGGLIAALIAATDPSLHLFINICGAPWWDLPPRMQENGPISIPSIHFLGKKDQLLDLPSLMSLPQNCHDPVLLMHPQGHAIPMLTTNMAQTAVQQVEAALRRKKIAGHLDPQVKPQIYQENTREPRLGDRSQGLLSSREDVVDSFAVLMRRGKKVNLSAQVIASIHARFMCSLFVSRFISCMTTGLCKTSSFRSGLRSKEVLPWVTSSASQSSHFCSDITIGNVLLPSPGLSNRRSRFSLYFGYWSIQVCQRLSSPSVSVFKG